VVRVFLPHAEFRAVQNLRGRFHLRWSVHFTKMHGGATDALNGAGQRQFDAEA